MKFLKENNDLNTEEVEDISDIIFHNYTRHVDELKVAGPRDIDSYYKILKNVRDVEKFNYHDDYWGTAEDYQEDNLQVMELLEPYIGKKVSISYDDGEAQGILLGLAVDKQYNSLSHSRVILDEDK